MLDINFIRDNSDKVKAGISAKGYDATLVDNVLKLDKQRREVLQFVESLRAERNIAADTKDIEKGKQVKEELKIRESELDKLTLEFKELMYLLPNLPAEDVPSGKSESDNPVLRQVGDSPKFSFAAKDHVTLGKNLDILDFESGAKVSGSGFYYLKNEGVLLELALVQYGIEFLTKKGFVPFITPDLAREKFYLGTGYVPKGPEAQTFVINGTDLGLIATAEVTLAGYHSDEMLRVKDLPKRYVGYSHCFRQESGAYGKYSKGLYRVHQFTKVEMFAYTTIDQSTKMHEELLVLEEEFWQSLGIPYRVLEMCVGDLGAQAVKKYDLEAWMPGRGDWGEVTSTSNTTDYQARNLEIRYKDGDKTYYVHTLNGTLVATSRAIIAILENYQQRDGSIKIPEVLQKFMGLSEIKVK